MPLIMRKAKEEDEEWLFEIYRTTMKENVEKIWGWDVVQDHPRPCRLLKGVRRH